MINKDTLLRSAREGAHPPITIRECQMVLDSVPTRTFEGSDGGFSTPASRGRHRFWFGDSVTAYGFQHSTVLNVEDGRMYPQRNQIIPKEGDIAYWPATAVQKDNGEYLVTCGGIIPTPGWFIAVDSKMAICKENAAGDVVFDRWLPGTINERVDPDDPGPNWNTMLLVGTQLHLFRTTTTESDPWSKAVFHRTADLDDPANKALWGPATKIVPDETDGSWSPWVSPSGKFCALSMDRNGRDAVVYTASTITGPWTKTVYPDVIPRDFTQGENVYVAHAHPWLKLPGEGTPEQMACTVSHSTSAEAAEGKHEYRIRFFKIPAVE